MPTSRRIGIMSSSAVSCFLALLLVVASPLLSLVSCWTQAPLHDHRRHHHPSLLLRTTASFSYAASRRRSSWTHLYSTNIRPDGGGGGVRRQPTATSRSSWLKRQRDMMFHPKSRLQATTPHSSFSTSSSSTRSGSSSSRHIIKLYNSRTRQKEPLVPVQEGKFSMYTCGPTVYDYAHVGNFRAFLTYDLLKRVLLYLGYDVEHVCNLTDVDDKIIARATQQGLSNVLELTQRYEVAFMDDLHALNIVPATHYPRATEHIAEMMEIISMLHENGLAYETSDGSWYFRTQSQPGYGSHLLQMNLNDMESQQQDDDGGSVTVVNEKEHFADFCLWKAFKEGYDRDDAAWSSESIQDSSSSSIRHNQDCRIVVKIKKGRPGWHLECSAMARKFFGDATIDLHGGGIDLKFPHHENEIAQSEGIRRPGGDDSSSRFCNCWFHNGFVNIADNDNDDGSGEGTKMSKSLGNGRTLREACPTAVDVRAYRYLVVSSQYRNPLAFTPAAMQASKNAVMRMDKIRQRIHDALDAALANDESTSPSVLTKKTVPQALAASVLYKTTIPAALADFETALMEDLSMPRASAALFSVIKAAEQEFNRHEKGVNADAAEGQHTDELDIIGLQSALNAMNKMDKIFGIFYEVPLTVEEQQRALNGDHSGSSSSNGEGAGVPDEVLDLVGQRTAAKEAKDWALADSLRSRITELGFAVQDVKGGEPIVTRV